jgi:prepilin-type N-terminal cleavage/methylation domain-containing protein
MARPWGSRGFTIIEVLIVLAVTGALFVSAAIMIAGRQQQTEFNQAIRQVQSQIQQVINEVAIGYYPNTNNFQCAPGASGPVLTPGTAEQGTSSGCIFMGKAMQFEIADTEPEQFAVYTVAGLQKTPAGKEVKNRAEAMPKIVAPSTSQPATPDTTTTQQLQGGLTTDRMWYNNGAVDTDVGAVVFITSLAPYSGGTVTSGSQRLHIMPMDGTSLDATMPATVEAMNANMLTTAFEPTGGVFICFVSGGTNQSGLIKIGSNARLLSVTLDIKSNKTCS